MQIKKGLVELIVLNLINDHDSYGYEIKQNVEKVFDINESSIYSYLVKAKANKYVETYLKESDSGPARKYFKITKVGKTKYQELRKSWEEYSTNINEVLNNGS